MAFGTTNLWLPVAACLLLASLNLAAAQAIRAFTLNVSYITSSPDCVQKTFFGINGAYPGPDLAARNGDRMIITVINSLNDTGVTMHWHGLYQAGSVWMDGPAYGTQCPIPPGGTFVYNFTVSQHGTFWYHGHAGLLRSSVYGLFKILPSRWHVPPGLLQNVSATEPKLLLNDWFWQNTSAMESRLGAAFSTGLFGQPSNVLINGRGRTNCSDPAVMQTCQMRMGGQNCSCANRWSCLHGVTTLEPLRYYRFRIVNVALHAHLNVQIQNHSMLVVEIDGNYIKPVTVTSLDTHPGMAFSVIVYLDQPVGNYWIRAAHRSEYSGEGLAVLRYLGAPAELPLVKMGDDWPSLSSTFGFEQQWTFRGMKNAAVYDAPLAEMPVAKRLVLRWNRNRVKLANGTDLMGRYSINNNSWVTPDTPIAYADYYGVPGVFDFNIVEQAVKPTGSGISYATQGTSIFDVPQNVLLEIVFQNNNPPGLNHPWHLHGMDFWIVGRGEGDFDTSLPLEAQTNSSTLNLVDPQYRNIALVASNTWVAVRVFTWNAGVWNVHCHLEDHMKNGMQSFLRVGNASYPGPPDSWSEYKCGEVE